LDFGFKEEMMKIFRISDINNRQSSIRPLVEWLGYGKWRASAYHSQPIRRTARGRFFNAFSAPIHDW